MADYCKSSNRAPRVAEMRDSVAQGAKENCSSEDDASLDLIAAMNIIDMVLYSEKLVDLAPLHGLFKRVMKTVKTRQSPLLGGNGDTYSASGDSRPVGAYRQPGTDSSSGRNPYRPAIISPFAARQSTSVHRQDHYMPPSTPPLYGGNIPANMRVQQDPSRTLPNLLSHVKHRIRESLKAVLQRENTEYLKSPSCWKDKVVPAVNIEFGLRNNGVTLFQLLKHDSKRCKELNEFLRQMYRTCQFEWNLQHMTPMKRAKKTRNAANPYDF